MRKHVLAVALLQALSFAAQAETVAAPAAEAAAASAAAPTELDHILVTGDINYRDRADETAPVLVYDLEYFQRFEPRTVGDMLKRVPSVAFLSDVLEYDGARLRGLDPGYTQVLINGKKVPGGGDDRSFFVDRIPAEVVERIEIVRATSANRSADAIAGAINIVLRDAYEFDGGYVRAGISHFDDGETKPTAAAVASGEFAGGRVLAGVSHQGRYNPKKKLSLRYDEPGGEFQNREDQDDTRDGTDDSLNLSYVREIGAGKLSLSGLYVRTDRTETEHSEEYNDRNSTSRDNLLSINDQVADIEQDNIAINGGYSVEHAGGGKTELSFNYARMKDHTRNVEEEIGYDDEETPPEFDEYEGTLLLSDLRDTEYGASLSHVLDVGGSKLQFGIDYTSKDRDFGLRTSEVDTDEEGEPLPPYLEFDAESSTIEERRVDPYLMFSGKRDALTWEAGLRYETTRRSVELGGDKWDKDTNLPLPSAHLRWDLSDAARVNFSVARSVRRPNFNYLLPVVLEGEYGDNDFIGNPNLELEKAWGADLGYEHRLGKRGVVGVNVFYRDVKDLIEITNTGNPSETALEDFEDEIAEFLESNPGALPGSPGYPVLDPDSFLFSAANVGDGYVYGVEFDLSTPLSALGLPNTGVFLNYSWLDSEVEDALGKRRFNDQAHSVFNVGFIQDLPSVNANFGVSYRRQGRAYGRILAEEVETRYSADLEAFIEKRFGTQWSVRLTGNNLLNAKKDEVFHKFNTLGEQIERDYDEYELETEQGGPVYQLVARYAW
jgi:outer membrane receptor protein involved in Fe transport